MEVSHQIAQLQRDTLHPDCGAVSTTNEALNCLSLLSDFPFALLFLALEAGDEVQKIAAATYLKNFTRRNIDDAHQPSKVSKEFKDKLFLVLLQAQPPVLKVLVEAFRIVVVAEFVKKNSSPKCVPDLLSAIQNSNILTNFEESRCKSINAITVLHALLGPFLYFLDPKVAQEPVPLQLKLIAKEILVPLLAIFHQYVEKDFKITGTRETEVEKTLLMVCKCMYFAVRSYMPSALAPLLSTFCHDLIGILGSLSLDHAVYLENECLMRLKTRKKSLQIFCVLVTRHRKYSDKLMLNIINCVLLIVKYSKIISLDYLSKRIVSLAFDVISRALETGLGWSLVSPHFSSLLDSAIFLALVMNEKDITEWEEDANEFIRKNLPSDLEEVSGWRDDLFTARKSAINLLGEQGSRRSSMGELLVLPILSKFPIPSEPNPTQSILNNYFGMLMAYGGLLDFLREQEPRYTILVQLHLLPLYKSSMSLPYLIGPANCLPEEMSADIYSLFLKVLTMADGDISAIGDQIPKIVVFKEGFELLSKAATSGPLHPKSDKHELHFCSYVSFHVCFKHFSGLFPKLICNLYEKAKSGKSANLCIIYREIFFFYELMCWANIDLKHNINVMHIENNVCDNLLGTLLTNPHKSKDTDNAKRDLENLGIKKELHLYEEGNKLMKPVAEYTLTEANRKLVLIQQYLVDRFISDGCTHLRDTLSSLKITSKMHLNPKVQSLKSIGLTETLEEYLNEETYEENDIDTEKDDDDDQSYHDIILFPFHRTTDTAKRFNIMFRKSNFIIKYENEYHTIPLFVFNSEVVFSE
ncbi:hypothetical protein UlMin_014483 [Ulmus minor]